MSDAYEYVGDKWQRRMQQPSPPTWKKKQFGPFRWQLKVLHNFKNGKDIETRANTTKENPNIFLIYKACRSRRQKII